MPPALLLALAAVLAPADAGPARPPLEARYRLDPAHTSIVFKVRHLDMAYVWGSFEKVSGGFTLDDSPTFTCGIPVASIDTNHDQRDDHLRGPKFFDAERHPAIKVESKSVERKKDASGLRYAVTADVTMHGATRELTFDLRLLGSGADPWGGYRAGFEAGPITIRRSDFGMDALPEVVGDEVTIHVSFEGIRE